MEALTLRRRVRWLLLFFIVALVASGLTAIPLRWETGVLRGLMGEGTAMERLWPAAAEWFTLVHAGLAETYARYPFIQYGTDWLAFAHIVIAIAFIGPLRNPVRNVWVVEFGLIACVLVVPMALIFGALRGIPPVWRLLDCSFGLLGFVPLWLARRDILRLAEIERAGASGAETTASTAAGGGESA